ncbi:alpha-glucan water dikinase 2-like [Bidens hawaiensis]|uniref:alpha-glucan water dikinase 2-like n=1 Tax=Bidens hawaiensis TaxID=980011 RepID=UPI00404B1E06
MASAKSSECIEIKKYKFHNGMVLQVDVSVFSSSHNAKVKLQLYNRSQTWILHWGCISNGNKKWFIPSFYPPGTTVYKKAALSTPFIKDGDIYVVDIELRDPMIHAIEFVLKNTKHDKWLKMNGASFRINLHKEIDASIFIM